MDIENSLQKKIDEVKPGEKGGGEEDMDEVVKGETVALGRAYLNLVPRWKLRGRQ